MTNTRRRSISALALFSCIIFATCSSTTDVIRSSNIDRTDTNEISREEIEKYFVVPGERIGPLRIGQGIPEVRKNLTGMGAFSVVEHSNFPTYVADVSIGDEMTNPHTKGNGIRGYFNNTGLFQISVDSYFYSVGPVTKNAVFDEVKIAYPEAISFQLEPNDKNKRVGTNEVRYLVDQSAGIAFEFYLSGEVFKVSRIHIFPQKADFLPLGLAYSPTLFHLARVK